MNAEQFYRIVVRMRAKQKEYFRTKNHKILIESKRLETQVDAEIDRVERLLTARINKELKFES